MTELVRGRYYRCKISGEILRYRRYSESSNWCIFDIVKSDSSSKQIRKGVDRRLLVLLEEISL